MMNRESNTKHTLPDILTRRPRLIIGITTLVTLGALIYALFIAKPVYQAEAMVQLGKINGGPAEPPESLMEKLSFKYKLDVPTYQKELPYFSTIKMIPKRRDLLLLKTLGRSSEDAVKLLQGEIDRLIERENKDVEKAKKAFEVSIENARQQVRTINSEINELRESIAAYEQKIRKLTKDDVALLGSYFLELRKIRYDIEKKEQWNSMESDYIRHTKLKLIDTTPPKLVDKIETSDKPIRPRKLLLSVIGFISGLLLSLLLVLFLDFLQESRRDKQDAG